MKGFSWGVFPENGAAVYGRFNMNPQRAALAVEFVKPKYAIPMHFGTFGVLQQSAAPFKAELGKLGMGTKFLEMKPGETRSF